MAAEQTATNDDTDKRVKINVEGEDETGEGEMGRKKMKRFTMPDVPRWWQAKIIQYALDDDMTIAPVSAHLNGI